MLTVACRATFVLRPGEMALASEQELPAQGECGYPDGLSLGLYAPSDRVPMKPHADVVLVGHAFAPGSHPVRSLIARLAVSNVDKRVEVYGERAFDRDGNLREGAPFSSIPLVYERAAGGPGTPNPIGMRSGTQDAQGRTALPNLQPPGLKVTSSRDPIPSIGLGPIADTWPSRRALLGPTASAAPSDDWHERIVPVDLHPAYFNVAPDDQRIQSLGDDERIVLENLYPNHAKFVTRLPGLRPRAFVEGLSDGPKSIAMRADTLWIETSRGLCTVTWRGQIPLVQTTAVTVLIALEEPGHSLTWRDVDRLRTAMVGAAHRLWNVDVAADQTLAAAFTVSEGEKPALPFTPAPTLEPPRESTSSGGLPLPLRTDSSAVRRPTNQDGVLVAEKDDNADATITSPLLAAADKALPWHTLAALPVVSEPHAVVAPVAPSSAALPADSPWARGSAPASAPSTPIAVAVQPTPVSAPVAVPWTSARTPAAASSLAGDTMHFVGFEPASMRRVRNDPRFARVLDALEKQPLDDDLDEPEGGDTAADVEDRREVFEILARGDAVGAEEVVSALMAAVCDDGRLVQPLLLVAGRIVLPFDELEALKATLSAATPHAGADLEAKGVLDLARGFLGTPGLPGAPAVSEGLRARIRQTFEKRSLVSEGYLEAQVKRALVCTRGYQRCSLFGAPHVCGFFEARDERIPIYLSEELSAKLPAVEHTRVRMLAQVHPCVDHQIGRAHV